MICANGTLAPSQTSRNGFHIWKPFSNNCHVEQTFGTCGRSSPTWVGLKGGTGNVETGNEETWKRRNEPWDYRVLDTCSPGTVSDSIYLLVGNLVFIQMISS